MPTFFLVLALATTPVLLLLALEWLARRRAQERARAPAERDRPRGLSAVEEFRALQATLPRIRAPLFHDLQAAREHPVFAALQADGAGLHSVRELPVTGADLHLVYTPGKVGTSTLARALRGLPSVGNPFHLHFLSNSGLRRLQDNLADEKIDPDCWLQQAALARWVRVLLAVNAAARADQSDAAVRKPFVVTAVRDPVALRLSAIFESWWLYAAAPQRLDVARVAQLAADESWYAGWANAWWTDELHEAFGIDVYAEPFPTERGWQVYENDRARVLLIRTEDLERLPAALATLYGIDPSAVVVDRANATREKEYAAAYETARAAVRLSEEQLRRIYGLPHVRHFYSATEIQAFRQRWGQRRPTRVAVPA